MRTWDEYRGKAEKLLNDRAGLLRLLTEAFIKAESVKTALEKVWEHLQALLRLLKSWARGEYRQIPWLSISLAAAAILYFVNPFDLIPDYIPVIGYLDDGAVIGIAIAAMGDDFEKFLAWERDGANNKGGCHVG